MSACYDYQTKIIYSSNSNAIQATASSRLLSQAMCTRKTSPEKKWPGHATFFVESLVGWLVPVSWKPHFWSANMPNRCTFCLVFFPSNERRFSELFHYLQKIHHQNWNLLLPKFGWTSFAKKETSFCPGTFFVHIGSDILFTSDRRRDLAQFAKVVNFSKGRHHHQQLQRGHCQLVHCQFLATQKFATNWLVGQSPRFFESNRLAAVV